MKLLSIVLLILGLSAVSLDASEESTGNLEFKPDISEKRNFQFKTIYQIAGQEILQEFISKSSITVVYYYKKDMHRIKFFFKELDKSAEYLELYGVKVGVVDCTAKVNADVKVCDLHKVEENVYTYRNGNQLLALELDTMFDVNSIMSNVLQLVMLRQVPITQTAKEATNLLTRMRKYDVIFGHMRAIGTFDHRVFMEVAYAYQDKFKFALSTDQQAITAFTELPTEKAESYIYVVFTKKFEEGETFHSIKYPGELTLPAFAKWLMLLSLPKMYNFPQDGLENPYADVDAPSVCLYYTEDNWKMVDEVADLISNFYWGTLTLTVVDMDELVSQETFPTEGETPSISILLSKKSNLEFMSESFRTENIAMFIESSLRGTQVEMDEEERRKDYDSPAPPEIHEDAPYIDSEALDVQDDEVADAVRKNKEPLPLDLVPALTDKTFHTTVEKANTALVYFYFPFDAMNMAFLRKYGEAVDRLGTDTKLSFSRVNCYDWTDVCALNNIMMYPTMRVFNNGVKSWDYRGPRDSRELYSTFRLIELNPPVYVSDPNVIKEYLLGIMNSDVKSFTSTVVVGLFTKKDKNEISVFTEVAKQSRDRILFVYSDIEDTKKIASQFNTQVPSVIISKYDDSVLPHVIYTGPYKEDSLSSFIQESKLPKLTMLTPLVFPDLYKRGDDFLILFTDDSPRSQDQENVLREVLKTGVYNNVSFTLLPVPDNASVGYKVLHQYEPEPTVPMISYVNRKMGEVFNYEVEILQKQPLMDWISSVTKRSIKPSSVLKDNQWKPVLKGFDFLRIIDWEKAQAKKKQKKQKESQDVELEDMREGADQEEESLSDESDEETRQELFELHNSRLYAKPHKHAGGKDGTSQIQEAEGTTQTQEAERTSEKHIGAKQTQESTGTKQKPVNGKESIDHKHTEL